MKSTLPRLSIKKGREWHLRRGHPWLFSGAISQAPKKLESGALVQLLDADGNFVATGYYNPNTDIAVRVLSRDPDAEINREFLRARVQAAWQLRARGIDLEKTNAFRLINAEGDFLPGFIVDYFADHLVVQSHTAGADLLLEDLLWALDAELKPSAIILRNDAGVRKREGLSVEQSRLERGELNSPLTVLENGFVFAVDPLSGQKTGFFSDQRDKRVALANYVKRACRESEEGENNKDNRASRVSRFLNCFSYTGSFSVYALAANSGLHTVNVDQSEFALQQAKQNFKLNNFSTDNHSFINEDAFQFLERESAAGSKYEISLLDPPAFAKSQKDKGRALKAYARMAALGISVTTDNGIVVLCSCSGTVSMDEFKDAIRQGAGGTGRQLQVLETFEHGLDHPVNLMAPEGSYLKVVFCRICGS